MRHRFFFPNAQSVESFIQWCILILAGAATTAAATTAAAGATTAAAGATTAGKDKITQLFNS